MMGKYVFTKDFDDPLRKGNQVTQTVNRFVLDDISKIKVRNYGTHSLKTDGRINGWIDA